jgi:hypothetical protein
MIRPLFAKRTFSLIYSSSEELSESELFSLTAGCNSTSIHGDFAVPQQLSATSGCSSTSIQGDLAVPQQFSATSG